MGQVAEAASTAEAELIQDALRGDNEAFSRLILRHARRIYRAVYFIVRNLDDAKDITQETFLRAYRNFQSFDAARPFYPWIHRIARNLSFNYLARAERRNIPLPEEEGAAVPPSGVASSGTGPSQSSADPAEAVIRSEEADALYRAIDRLSVDHREIIMLKHFGECSYAEIAEILGIPIGTVMSRLYNARMKLKSILLQESDR